MKYIDDNFNISNGKVTTKFVCLSFFWLIIKNFILSDNILSDDNEYNFILYSALMTTIPMQMRTSLKYFVAVTGHYNSNIV